MTEIELDKVFLPPTATIKDVMLVIESFKVDGKDNILSSHKALIKEGPIANQIAVCYEIVDQHTGEFHHYAIEIFNLHKYTRKGWKIKDVYRITDTEQLLALQRFLTIIANEELEQKTETRILVNESEFLRLKEIAERSNSTVIRNLLEQKETLEEIFQQGGENFLKKFIQWFRKNQQIEGVTELFQEMLGVFGEMKNEAREMILESFRRQNLTKEDLDILSGRKEGLRIFEQQLSEDSTWGEKGWQEFFENNDWILGYGLDYRFLQILQREAHLSDVDLDGKNDVIGDFLAGCSNFTVLVELKKPDTELFKETRNRADSWKLSSHLTDAVSQILSQKANWTIKSESENYNSNNELITQETHDPKTILIIGNTNQFKEKDRMSKIKRKTFELFRRNLRNIEIFTFDELLERAKFIVKERNISIEVDTFPTYGFAIASEDDIPF